MKLKNESLIMFVVHLLNSFLCYEEQYNKINIGVFFLPKFKDTIIQDTVLPEV